MADYTYMENPHGRVVEVHVSRREELLDAGYQEAEEPETPETAPAPDPEDEPEGEQEAEAEEPETPELTDEELAQLPEADQIAYALDSGDYATMCKVVSNITGETAYNKLSKPEAREKLEGLQE